jgi:hypothetical protein
MQFKTCPKCEQTLPFSCFYANRRKKDGKRVYCKACEADSIADWKVAIGRTKKRREPKD